MVTVCQQCGDEGFTNALIYCDECNNYAVHRYCLEILPKTFDEYVIWLCEDCEPKSVKAFALDCACPLPIKERENLENVQVNKSRPIRRLGKKSKGSVQVKKSWPNSKLRKKSKGRKVSSHSSTDLKLPRPDHYSCHKPLEVHCSEISEKGQEIGKYHGLDEGISSEVTVFQSKNSLLALCDPQNLEDYSDNCEKDQKLRIGDKLDDLQLVEMDCCSGGGNNQRHGEQNVSREGRFNEEAESNEAGNFQLATAQMR